MKLSQPSKKRNFLESQKTKLLALNILRDFLQKRWALCKGLE